MALLLVLLSAAGLAVLLPTLWLALQIGSASPSQRRRSTPAELHERAPLAVLVPAHDEAEGIAMTLRSIRRQLLPHDRLLVVADNCRDHTAAVAAANGAEVVQRSHATLRGKGHALAHGVATLAEDPREVLVVVDADCRLGAGALDALAHQVATTGRPAQALYLMGNLGPAPLRQRFAEFAWRLKNGLRPLGLREWGLPCQLAGSGMAFPWHLLQRHSLASGHLAEDMELGLALTLDGAAPLHCPDALVTSVFPTDAAAQQRQRTRWEHGHLSLIGQALPRLLRAWARRPRAATLALALDLAIPPLSLLALANGVLLAAGALALAGAGDASLPAQVLFVLAFTSATLFTCAVALGWHRVGRGLLTPADLLRLPLLALAKLPLYLRFVTARQRSWVRTARAGEATGAAPPLHKSTDFSRDVVAVLGMPFDVLSQAQAEQRVIEAMNDGRKLLMSTPNLNFVATCQRDAAFRQSVLVSDLSVADGAGVMLVARLLGTPLPERIAGSTLFDNLVRHVPRTLKVFLFGGGRDVAATAAEHLNERTACATAVGWQSPGFGDVATLTTPGQLQEIRRSRPNFLLVALGAQKGQRWILQHYDALPACVISHLGATINFVAGTVVRAPLRLQRLGLEWLWRIKEEPHLWQRYARDGAATLRALGGQWLQRFVLDPLLLRATDAPPTLALTREDDVQRLGLSGTWTREHGPRLALTLAALARTPQDIQIHCEDDARLDPYILGKLLLLLGHQAAVQRALHVSAERGALLRSLRRQGLHDLAPAALAPQAPQPATTLAVGR